MRLLTEQERAPVVSWPLLSFLFLLLFFQIARGLNREKLSLLKYKLTEIIDANKLTIPKLVIMLTDLSLSFIDGSNLEILFDSVIADSRIQKRNAVNADGIDAAIIIGVRSMVFSASAFFLLL